MSQENVEVMRRLYDRWSTGDLGAFDVFDTEIEFARIGPSGTGLDGEFRGIEAVLGAVSEWLQSWRDVSLGAERILDVGGDRVLVLSRQTGRGRESGTPLDLRMADIWTLRNGKCVRWETYWSRADALEAVGLSE